MPKNHMPKNIENISRRNFLRAGSLLCLAGCVSKTSKEEYEIVHILKEEYKVKSMFDIPGYSVKGEKWEPHDVTTEIMGQEEFDSWKSFSKLYKAFSSNGKWAIANIEKLSLEGRFMIEKFNGQFGRDLLIDLEKEKIYTLDLGDDKLTGSPASPNKNSFSVSDKGGIRYDLGRVTCYDTSPPTFIEERVIIADSPHSRKFVIKQNIRANNEQRDWPHTSSLRPQVLTSPDGNIIFIGTVEKRNPDMYDTLLQNSQGVLQPSPIDHPGFLSSNDSYVIYAADINTSKIIFTREFSAYTAVYVRGMNHDGTVLAVSSDSSDPNDPARIGQGRGSLDYYRVDIKNNTRSRLSTSGWMDSFKFSPDGNFCVASDKSDNERIDVFINSPRESFTIKRLNDEPLNVENNGDIHTNSNKVYRYSNGIYFLEGAENPKIIIEKSSGRYYDDSVKQKIVITR